MISIIAYKDKTKNITARKTGESVYEILKNLGDTDSIFLSPLYYRNSRKTQLIISKENEKETKEQIAHCILNGSKNDLLIDEGIKNPTIDYVRIKDGFSFNSSHKTEKNLNIEFSYGAGYQLDGIVIGGFGAKLQYPIKWYQSIFNKIIKSYNPNYATIAITNQRFNKLQNEFNLKFKIGWKTYFSNSNKDKIEGEFENISTDKFHEGTIYSISNDTFLDNKENYENYEIILRDTLQQICITNKQLLK